MRGVTRYVVVYRDGRALVGRSTLAELSGRPIPTIRVHCTVVDHEQGQALYDMEDALAALAAVPTRRRTPRVGLAA